MRSKDSLETYCSSDPIKSRANKTNMIYHEGKFADGAVNYILKSFITIREFASFLELALSSYTLCCSKHVDITL